MILQSIVIGILIALTNTSVAPFSEEIANQILSKDEVYLIYVTTSTDHEVFSTFEGYCEPRSNCTVLQASNELHEHITSFIGYEKQEYLLIIDAHEHLKYIFPIDASFSTSNLQQFESQYALGQLEPFFASQEEPEQINFGQKCMKLVGTTYEQFLVQEEPVKIVFLYTQSSFCSMCEKLLQQFISLSQKYFERRVIRFGYVDVLKNDNRFIKDEIMPYFLIYVRQNFDDPYGVGADQFDELESYIKQLVSDTKGSRYTEPASVLEDEM